MTGAEPSAGSAENPPLQRRQRRLPWPPLPSKFATRNRPLRGAYGLPFRRISRAVGSSAGTAGRPRRVGSSVLAGIACALASALLLALSPSDARAARQSSPASSEVAEKRSDLKELREQIETMRKQLAAAEESRADAADQLKDTERGISALQRELHELAEQRGELQERMARMAVQSRELEGRLAGQQQQLEELVRRQYRQGEPDLLRLLLNGDDPSQTARDLRYLSAIGQARSELLQQISKAIEEKQALAADTRERAAELSAVEAKQQERRASLVQRREERKQALDKISARIAQQRKEIGAKERDERRLSQLVAQLTKIIAARPAPRREPTPVERPTRDKPARERTEQAPALVNERLPEAQAHSVFARLKGELRLPVKGVISGRFGSSRPEGGTWKGLFIRAASGTPVRAIANGRVVFADWMRGFGNLLIVDHSDGYLSIYGNNDALLKQVGDVVRSGDAVAAVGDSGGIPESGLYFELRQQGQALDPMKWVSTR